MPARTPILLLIDENVPESVAEFFRGRGHDVQYVREVLAAGAPDALIAASGDAVAAVVVTWNRRHFKKLADRRSEKYPRLGLLTFSCSEAEARARIEKVIDIVEDEYERSQRRPDKRFMMDIGRTRTSIDW